MRIHVSRNIGQIGISVVVLWLEPLGSSLALPVVLPIALPMVMSQCMGSWSQWLRGQEPQKGYTSIGKGRGGGGGGGGGDGGGGGGQGKGNTWGVFPGSQSQPPYAAPRTPPCGPRGYPSAPSPGCSTDRLDWGTPSPASPSQSPPRESPHKSESWGEHPGSQAKSAGKGKSKEKGEGKRKHIDSADVSSQDHAKVSQDHAKGKGKRNEMKPRSEMTQEEKKMANAANRERVKKQRQAQNKARPGEAAYKEPKYMDE